MTSRQELLDIVRRMMSIIERGHSASDLIMLRKYGTSLAFVASNNDTSIRIVSNIGCDLPRSTRLIVEARRLSKVLAASKADELELFFTASALQVKMDRRTMSFATRMEKLDPGKPITEPTGWNRSTAISVVGSALSNALLNAARCGIRTSMPWSVKGVAIQQKDGKLMVAGTDGFVLAHTLIPIVGGELLGGNFVLSLGSCTTISKLCQNSTSNVAVCSKDEKLGFTDGSFEAEASHVRNTEVPQYEVMLSQELPNILKVDKAQLLEALSLARIQQGEDSLHQGCLWKLGDGVTVSTVRLNNRTPAEIRVLGSYEGVEMIIKLDPKKVQLGLDMMDDGEITIRLRDSEMPVRMDKNGLTFMVMPMVMTEPTDHEGSMGDKDGERDRKRYYASRRGDR